MDSDLEILEPVTQASAHHTEGVAVVTSPAQLPAPELSTDDWEAIGLTDHLLSYQGGDERVILLEQVVLQGPCGWSTA